MALCKPGETQTREQLCTATAMRVGQEMQAKGCRPVQNPADATPPGISVQCWPQTYCCPTVQPVQLPANGAVAEAAALLAKSADVATMGLEELQELSARIRKSQSNLFRAALEMANQRMDTSVIGEQAKRIRELAGRVGTAIRIRAEQVRELVTPEPPGPIELVPRERRWNPWLVGGLGAAGGYFLSKKNRGRNAALVGGAAVLVALLDPFNPRRQMPQQGM